MTNAEKYLKDGTDIKEIANGINEAYLDCHEEEDLVDCVYRWFETKGIPTLTEDERVILRNIDENEYQKIARQDGALFLIGDNFYGGRDTSYMFGTIFKSDLFQFIKERRRIFNRRTFERRIKNEN